MQFKVRIWEFKFMLSLANLLKYIIKPVNHYVQLHKHKTKQKSHIKLLPFLIKKS